MPKALVAGDLARRLVEKAAEGTDPEDSASAAQVAIEHTHKALARSLGSAGAHALLTRAVIHTRTQHPSLRDIRIEGMSELGLRGVSDMVAAHGNAVTTRALQALLEALLALLCRLIGDDMVSRLVEPQAPKAHGKEKAR